jgi:hypothetical protein
MDWRCGSSDRVPALQAQSPKFKPQYHQKINKQKSFRPIVIQKEVKTPFILTMRLSFQKIIVFKIQISQTWT